MSITNSKREKKIREYGWSENSQSQFFQFAEQIIGEDYKGSFTIKEVKGRWFWYYQL